MSWLKSKIKMVAARASDALAQAADIVAPTLYESRVDEFHHRWTTISRFLASVMSRDVDAQEQRRLLNDSHTRDSLQKLVLLIYAEENETDRVELGLSTTPLSPSATSDPLSPTSGTSAQPLRACLEYLLERQLIPHLCDAGRRDQPCGIMPLALQFVAALLGRVNYPILPTREVHESVVALIQAAAKKEVDDPVVRKCLIALLSILWKKLRCDPVQTEFFFMHADRASTTKGHGISDLVLFTGLLPHMYAAKAVGEKCREALVIAASFHEPRLSRFILKLTPFCHYAVNGVISAYDSLPKTRPERLPRSAAVANAGPSTTRDIDAELNTLASRLRFCCTLAMVGQYELPHDDGVEEGMATRPSISTELLALFQERFLEGPLTEGLMHTSEATARTATLYARIILEELAACCKDTNANPLLFAFVQFLVDNQETETTSPEADSERRLPLELMHRMDSLSSSLAIATMDLFTSLLELQDEFVDRVLLGRAASDIVTTAASRRRASISALSPRGQTDSAIWLASRFPESAVAANAHMWKIQGFDGLASKVEIPASAVSESESTEDEIASLLSYIADAEYATCQRAPAVISDDWDSDEDEVSHDVTLAGQDDTPSVLRRDSEGSKSSASSRTAATRNSMKPLKQVHLTLAIPTYSPVLNKLRGRLVRKQQPTTTQETSVFVRLVLHRLERVLESSFYESLALSGLISTLAQKNQCASIVFDIEESRGSGESFRSVLEEVHADAVRRTSRLTNGHARLTEIRRKLVDENNEAALNDHEPETRLLCGYVVLEEILKELCSIAFAKDRVRSLPVKPEGYYLEPKRLSLTSTGGGAGTALGENGVAEDSSGQELITIRDEIEQIFAEVESTIGPLEGASSDGLIGVKGDIDSPPV